jgi:predicted alpha/beta-hydrolase family hydrolase
MLFVQGTRNKLADMAQLAPVTKGLGRKATVRPVDLADHGLHVSVRSGRNDEEVLEDIADAVAIWMARILPK